MGICNLNPEPILENAGMGAIFQRKGKEMLKKWKFENLSKNVQNLKIFRKSASYCMR